MKVRFNGYRLRALRKSKGKTQGDVADGLGVSTAAVSAWERGEAQPSPVHYPRMVAAYGCEVVELLRCASGPQAAELHDVAALFVAGAAS